MQQQSDRVSISIRAARDWMVLFYIAFFLVFGVGVPLLLMIVLDHGGGTGHRADLLRFQVIWVLACWVGLICFLVSRIAWGFGGTDSISLSATELRLSSTLFGMSIRRRVAATSEVRNLRFVPSRWVGNTYIRSKIRYEDARGTAKIAADLDEVESLALIDLMLAVYPFPEVNSR